MIFSAVNTMHSRYDAIVLQFDFVALTTHRQSLALLIFNRKKRRKLHYSGLHLLMWHFFMKTIENLKVGESAEVSAVRGEGTSLRRRLLDMGITPNTKVTMVRSAPLGDPIELNVRGYSLTIRRSDAALVEVKE